MTATTGLSYEEAKSLADRYECAANGCHGRLSFTFVPDTDNEWQTFCGKDRNHDGMTPIVALAQAVREEGGHNPLAVADDKALMSVMRRPETAISIIMAQNDKLSRAAAAWFYANALDLGLNPMRHEMAALTFNADDKAKKVVELMITRKGWAILAAREEPTRYLGPPALTLVQDDEGKAALGYGEKDYVVIAKGNVREVDGSLVEHQHHSAFRANEYEKVRQYERLPSGQDPWNQAMERAARRWYERVFPNALANAEAHYAGVKMEEGDIAQILEAEFRVVEDKPEPAPARGKRQPAPAAPAPAPAGAAVARDPAKLESINDLYRACHDDWNLQPNDVNKILGVSNAQDIPDVSKAYLQVKAKQEEPATATA